MNLLTAKQVAAKLNCARSFVWTLCKQDPTFPKPIQLGLGEERARASRWVEEALNEWLRSKQQPKEVPDETGRTGPEVHSAA